MKTLIKEIYLTNGAVEKTASITKKQYVSGTIKYLYITITPTGTTKVLFISDLKSAFKKLNKWEQRAKKNGFS